jgi:hypothetical protein
MVGRVVVTVRVRAQWSIPFCGALGFCTLSWLIKLFCAKGTSTGIFSVVCI